MNLASQSLKQLTAELRSRGELSMKQDIQLAAQAFGRATESAWFPSKEPIYNGDDATALPTSDGYMLFAAEGMRPEFVAADPWFAGYCSVMVNVNDIAAMGGRPWAVVDVLFLGSGGNQRMLEGMSAASEAFGVPVVGGHTARVSGSTLLAVAVLGRAKSLISSSQARPGQILMAAIDLNGSFRGAGGNFNAATTCSGDVLRKKLEVLPALAESGLVRAGKDISMAGTCGTLLMLLESSRCGAVLELSRIPAPPEVDPLRWLCAFPSFGFVLAVDEERVAGVSAAFAAVDVACAPVGRLNDTQRLELTLGGELELFWDLGQSPLTGFG
jgi:AIR synthase-related protein